MNKIIYLLGVIILTLTMSSCEDYLDNEPDNILTMDMVFENKNQTEQWLMGVYSYVRDPMWGLFYNDGNGALSDDVQIPLAQAEWGGWAVKAQQGNWTSNSDYGTDVWGNTYKAVRSANLFIAHAKELPVQGLSADSLQDMKLQARFLKAYFYTKMLKMYGPFPLIKDLVETDASIQDLMAERTPLEEIVDYLDVELLEIAEELPLVRDEEATNYGKPTKGACLAIRADMLLFAASPLFNGADYYKDVENTDGTKLFPQQYDATKWQKAVDAFKLFFDETGSTYDLYKEYNTQGGIDPLLSLMDMFTASSESNPEVVWARPSATISDWMMATAPRSSGGYGFCGATQEIVDAFYDKNGLAIDDPNSVYTEIGKSVANDIRPETEYNRGNSSATPGLVAARGTYNMYVNREPRFYASIMFNGRYYPFTRTRVNYKYNGADGLPSLDMPVCGYLISKMTHDDAQPRNGYVPYYQGIMIRLAEMYLGYAEALNESDPTNTDIVTYINIIHERAGIPSIEETYPEIIGNQDAMREYIRKERRIEFAFERDIRYNDLRRWMIADEVFSQTPTGMNVYGRTDDDFYQRTEAYTGKKVFLEKEYLWPIRLTYINNNPQLVQNKDW